MKCNIGIIYCPRHKWFVHLDSWKKVQALLNAEAIDYDMVESKSRDSVFHIAKKMINNGYKTIIVMGGDSALREVIQALMSVEETIRQSISFGVIPNGAENDFAKFWQLTPDNYIEAIRAIKRGKTRKIDVGCLSFSDNEEDICRHYFLGSVNFGLIAREMIMLRRFRHLIGSRRISFAATMALLIFQKMEYKMHIRVNGSDIERPFMAAGIGNTSCYGLTPSASPYDGMLDVSLIHYPMRKQLVAGFGMLMRRNIINHKSLSPFRTFSLEIVDSPNCALMIDGMDIKMPRNGFSINVCPEQINFLIPL